MTPREISVVLKAALWRQEQAARMAVVTAWTTASLMRATKLPRLETLLKKRSKAPMTPEQQRVLWLDFAARHGLTVIKHDKPVVG